MKTASNRIILSALLAGSMAFTTGTISAQATQTTQTGTVPDAQVESNVLKAFASESRLQNQNIQTSVVYGTVTLSGSVDSEESRQLVENLASRAPGVKKVVDQLSIGAVNDAAVADGAAALADAQNPNISQPEQNAQQPMQDPNQPPTNNGQPARAPYNAQQQPNGGQYPPQNPGQQPQFGGQQPNGGQYPPPGPQGYAQQPYGPPQGQVAGRQVTIPQGSWVQIRISQGVDSKHTQPGTTFDGVVVRDVVADGAIAIPRGATVHGTVVDAKGSGAISGRGQIALQLNQVTMGGQAYAVSTEPWTGVGRDKTIQTVNSAVGMGALGAIIGGVAGGGVGAAAGAAVGGGLGVAGSAATPNGNVLVPPESVLNFRIAAPTMVATVGQDELNRLSYGAGPGGPGLVRRGYPPPPPYYYRRYYYPGYYPGYYYRY